MQVLNLAYPQKSQIVYQLSPFPDGQQQIYIDESIFNSIENVKIVSRLNNFLDLEVIICAVKSLNHLKVDKIHLSIPYFLGSRSDRKFKDGSNNYLRDVICPIVNNLNFDTITVFDPHSDVLQACLPNINYIDNQYLVDWMLEQIGDNNIYLSPDAGAIKKIYNLNLNGEIVNCSKHRENGIVIKTIVPYINLSKNIVIIDDICDGGATFINIAKIIKERFEEYEHKGQNHGKLYLCVSHGIFSKGFNELAKYFDGIFCSNSYKDVNDYNIGTMKMSFYENWLKQYDIFKNPLI